MFAFTNGFNNISLYDYCITPRTVGPDIMEVIQKKCDTPNVKFQVAKQVSVFLEKIIKDCLSKGMEYEDLRDKIMNRQTEKLLSSNASGEYLQLNQQQDAQTLMLVSPQYYKEKADLGGFVPHERQKDLTTNTQRELLNKILDNTGFKTRLRAVYLPMGKELHDQSDDIIIKDIKRNLEITQDNARNNEKIEDRVNRIALKKSKLPKRKTKNPIEKYYLSAATGITSNVGRPNFKPKSKPENKPNLRGMCTTCKAKIGRSPISNEALRQF